ncbi:MAG: COX15/CtaA family protein [Bacteroidota bacterium]
MKSNNPKKVRLFRKISLITLIAVYLLILVGGVVRSTGSGMGCPDWPKCFGSWVPPTHINELPSNYKEIYSQKREAKNIRFAQYLTAFGYDKTAQAILNDDSILEEADFNAVKTWIEYINRLIGAVIGLLILGTAVASFSLKRYRSIPIVAVTTFVLVVFQGWIGSVVVSTNLLPWMITIHMFIALVIVALLIWLYAKVTKSSNYSTGGDNRFVPYALVLCMILTLVQIAMGTQVREAIDRVAVAFDHASRDLWIESLGLEFFIHRSFSWLILLAHMVVFYLLRKSLFQSKLVKGLAVVLLVSILSGLIMAYGAIPPAIQPLHLLVGTLGFGLQFLLFLQFVLKKRVIINAE